MGETRLLFILPAGFKARASVNRHGKSLISPPILNYLAPAQCIPLLAEDKAAHDARQSATNLDSLGFLQGANQSLSPQLKEPSMNLDESIQKHAEWKLKFRAAISRKEQIDADTIGKDNCC